MSKKKKSNGNDNSKVGIKKIRPKTINQNNYVKSLEEYTLIFSIGPAGTGKTLLAVDYAINNIIKKNFRKVIITRPVVEAGENLGFLPGDLYEKLDPYVRPIVEYIADIMGTNGKAKEWIDNHVEIAPLAYMRGRTFNDSILILDEAQNASREQIKMFLTRIGENSKAIITADPSQIDLKDSNRGGINDVIKLLEGLEGIDVCRFDNIDVIRSRIVQIIVDAYEGKKEIKTKVPDSYFEWGTNKL